MRDIHGGDWAGYQIEYGKEPLDFSMSISPLGIPEKAKAAAKAALEEPARYPDPHSRRLREALAAHHRIPVERIVCGNGAADLIWRLVQAVKPRRALVPVPTFTEYRRALESAGCAVVPWTMEAPAFSLTEEILNGITEDTGLVFLCEPDNPTGKRTDPALLQKIRIRCREIGCLLVIDECFMEFVSGAEQYTAAAWLRDDAAAGREEPLVVLRAFTKTFAMASLRLGYALCGSRSLAEQIYGSGQPWPVSTAAEAAGIAALEETAYVRRLRSRTEEERLFLERDLRECGCTVVSGEANYILFSCSRTDLAEYLKEKGILIRDCSRMEGLGPGWFRTAVRGREDNEELIRQIRACCGAHGDPGYKGPAET